MTRRAVWTTAPYRRVEDDDDIQDYKKPWIGLTDEEIFKIAAFGNDGGYFGDFQWQHDTLGFVKAIEAKLRSKNAT